jgi:hypothetical protein
MATPVFCTYFGLNFPLCRSLSTRLIDDDSITGDTYQKAPVERKNLLKSGVSRQSGFI